MNEDKVMNEVREYKTLNKHNNIIIVVLSVVLVFVLAVMVYVRFFS